MFDPNKFAAIQIGLASPEEIESWAKKDPSGKPYQVTKAETVNYRTQKPEEDGLFCEKIFGPSKDYECRCGKYKKKAYAGTVCEKCHVEITTKAVRRERMSFIDLACPVTHIWYLKGMPSRISLVLGVSPKDLEEVAYFISHITLNKGVSPFKENDRTVEYFIDREVLDEQAAKDRFKRVLTELLNQNIIPAGSEDEAYCQDYLDSLDQSYLDFSSIARFIAKYYPGLEFGYGAEAIQRLLASINLKEEYDIVKAEWERSKDSKTDQQKNNARKRLEVIEAFIKSGNKPEWMIITKLPVIPPDLRPMLPLDGSRFASADLNELYRRVIQRNISLQQFIRVDAPEVMLINAKRVLQEAVDALIDNGRRTKAVTSTGNRPFKSLSAVLKGKQGRFRQNLLGKRVDYSGRSVIAVGPTLRMDECGLPREMAVQLFRPFIAHKLVEKGHATNAKIADTLIENNDKNMWECLDEVIAEHPVLLNRAPTLHRLGIQAFHPRLVEGRAIRLFPLATTAFNADFDGDQMAVHVPLSNEAIWEAENLMLGSKNILKPASGTPVVTPTKDMVLGNYFLTMEEDANDFDAKIEEAKKWGDNEKISRYELYKQTLGKVFASKEEAIVAYQTKQINLHSRIAVRGSGMHNSTFTAEQNKSYLVTTVGKIIFNEIFDDGFPFLNNPKTDKFDTATPDEYFLKPGCNIKEEIAKMPKKEAFAKGFLSTIIDEFLKHFGVEKTSEMLNKMKDVGFKFSTESAVTVSLYDIRTPENKKDLIEEGQRQVDEYEQQYEEGLLTANEKHKLIVSLWTDKINKQMEKRVYENFIADVRNPFVMMSLSGAGGNKSNFNQLAGMRGNMNKPNGDVIELPIKSSLRDGLSVSEFFNSTHGTRKGGADTALNTAKSGYLTRRLVDVGQDIIIRDEDCHCEKGLVVKAIYNTADGTLVESLQARIIGRYSMRDIVDPKTGEVLVEEDTIITEADAKKIIDAGIKEVEIRSVFTCESKNGVCQKCYGINLANLQPVKFGEAVGVIAAQSIGEPGTQLTMRNFNTGGVAGGTDITQGLPRVEELFEARRPIGEALITLKAGVIKEISETEGKYTFRVVGDEDNILTSDFGARLAAHLDEHGEVIEPLRPLKVGDKVIAGQKLTEGPVDPKKLLSATDTITVQKYILKEVQEVYMKQHIEISDKHIEIMIKQMFKDVKIKDSGDTTLPVGKTIPIAEFKAALNETLVKGLKAPTGSPQVLGITKSSLDVDSFLSAASFQETTRVLTDAVIKGKIDNLHGLKENVITGKLIPAGTGLLDKRFATPEEDLDK